MAGQTHLSGEQRQAIRAAVENKLSLITGGPGTGKTICLRSLVALLEQYRYRPEGGMFGACRWQPHRLGARLKRLPHARLKDIGACRFEKGVTHADP